MWSITSMEVTESARSPDIVHLILDKQIKGIDHTGQTD